MSGPLDGTLFPFLLQQVLHNTALMADYSKIFVVGSVDKLVITNSFRASTFQIRYHINGLALYCPFGPSCDIGNNAVCASHLRIR